MNTPIIDPSILTEEQREIITYQQAKALKECGFGWKTPLCYDEGQESCDVKIPYQVSIFAQNHNESINVEGDEYISAPTQALAQKWLREVKNWHIIIEPYNYHGIKTTGYLYRLYNPIRGFENHNQRIGFVSYESALSAGIDAALEQIKNKSK